MPDPQNTGVSTPAQTPPPIDLSNIRVRPVSHDSDESAVQTVKRNLSYKPDTSRSAYGSGHQFDAEPSPQAEGEQIYKQKFGSTPEQWYGHAKRFIGHLEDKVSDKVLKPFRSGLDAMADDLQHAAETGHTAGGGQLNPTTRALVGGAGAALRAVPVGSDVKSTALMSVVPPELGPEAKNLSKEIKAGEGVVEKAAPNLEGLRTREVSPVTAVESSAKEAVLQHEAEQPWHKYPATENLAKQAEERGNELVFRRVRSPEEAQAILESLEKGKPHEGFRTASIVDGHALSTKAPKIQAAIKKGAVPVFTSPYPTAANWYKGGADLFLAIEHTPEGKIYASSRAGQTQGAAYSATFPDAEHVIDARSIKNVSVLSPEQIEQIAEHEKNFEAGVRKGAYKGAYKDVDPELARANLEAARNLSPVVKSLGRPFTEAPLEISSGLKVKKGDRVRFANGATGVLSDFREFTPEQSTGFWKGEKHGFTLNGVKGELPTNYEGETQDSARLNQMGRDITAVWDKENKKWVEPGTKTAPQTEPKKPALHERLFSQALESLGPELPKTAAKVKGNYSSESEASTEAINRLASEKKAGTQRLRVDSRSGNEIPLIGVGNVDILPGPYDYIIQRGSQGDTILDAGQRARPYRPKR